MFYPYAGTQQYLSGILAYIDQARADGATVIVAMPEARQHLLRNALPTSGNTTTSGGTSTTAPTATSRDSASNNTVTFMDTAALGSNPGRLIPAWQDWISQRSHDGEVRGISESVWIGRPAAQLSELRYHEWLLNRAFATTAAWSLLCPYEIDGQLPDAERTLAGFHPLLWNGVASVATTHYAAQPYAFEPFDEPPDSYDGDETSYTFENLPALREHVSRRAAASGLPAERVRDLVLAASEIASNSIRHGGGSGTLRTWVQDSSSLICEFRDAGVITDPLAGRIRPVVSHLGGCGLWFVHQLCDLVEIRSNTNDGTHVRLHIDLSTDTKRPAPHDHRP
jgi:anti-sigma regulatory factor (Ser/Thr protein kinase)